MREEGELDGSCNQMGSKFGSPARGVPSSAAIISNHKRTRSSDA